MKKYIRNGGIGCWIGFGICLAVGFRLESSLVGLFGSHCLTFYWMSKET